MKYNQEKLFDVLISRKRLGSALLLALLALGIPVCDSFSSVALLRHRQQKYGQTTHRQLVPRLGVVTEKGANSVDKGEKDSETFFVRRCLPAEIGQASDILTEAFFKNNTNFFTYQWERLTTYLSLESTYPKPGQRHALFVACHVKNGRVLGLAEIDDMPSKDRNATPRPYMCNVAVDPKWKRKGIAKALVLSCEEIAQIWGKQYVYLKVRDSSHAAIAMYESLGYATRSSKIEKLNNKYQNLIVMSKKVLEDDDYGDEEYHRKQ